MLACDLGSLIRFSGLLAKRWEREGLGNVDVSGDITVRAGSDDYKSSFCFC